MTGLSELGAHVDYPTLIFGLGLLGMVIGVLTGLFGVGGGFLVVPLLSVLFGIPYQIAIGSSLCMIIGSSASGVARHVRLGNVEPKVTLILAGGSVCGTVLGVMLNFQLSVWFGPLIYEKIVDVTYILLLTMTIMVLNRSQESRHAIVPLLARLPLPPRIDLPNCGQRGISLPGLTVAGLGIGLLTGMLGIGGGVLLMPLLVSLVGLSMHQAVGTSLGVVFFSSIMGTLKYGLRDSVSLGIAMVLLMGGTVGIQVGAHLCQRLHAERLGRYFSILIGLVILLLAWSLLDKLWFSGG